MVKKNEEVKPQTGLVMADLSGIKMIKGYNPRQVDVKSQSFLELVESIRAQGVIVPIHVRAAGGPAGSFELLAGERRYRAAQAAELTIIPAINHGTISDEQAFEITFAENFAREDLTTLEQGRAVGLLLERYKGDYAAVAGKLGKAESWVRMRHAIETNISEEWKKEIAPGGRLEHFTAAHLGLVARFPANVQATILKEIGYRRDMSVKDLAEIVADMLRLIRKASFDTAKCIKCAKRSDAQPQLWTDPASQKVGTSDRCLDAQCWARKDLEARKEKLAELRAKYPGLVSICTKGYLYGDEAKKAASSYGEYLIAGDYETCKKTDPKAVPAVIVNGKGTGKIQYVKIKHPDSLAAQKVRVMTLKDRRKELFEARRRVTIRRICEQIDKMTFDTIMGTNGLCTIVWMAAIYGTGDGSFGQEREALIKEFEKGGAESTAAPLRVIWERFRESMDYIAESIGAGEREGRILTQLFGLDLDAEYKKVSEDPEFAEPAEWKNLNADGTPKKEKTESGGQKTAKSKKTKGKSAAGRDRAENEACKDRICRICRVCGCTDDKACRVDGKPRHWVEPDFCSACSDKLAKQTVGKPDKKEKTKHGRKAKAAGAEPAEGPDTEDAGDLQ